MTYGQRQKVLKLRRDQEPADERKKKRLGYLLLLQRRKEAKVVKVEPNSVKGFMDDSSSTRSQDL